MSLAVATDDELISVSPSKKVYFSNNIKTVPVQTARMKCNSCAISESDKALIYVSALYLECYQKQEMPKRDKSPTQNSWSMYDSSKDIEESAGLTSTAALLLCVCFFVGSTTHRSPIRKNTIALEA